MPTPLYQISAPTRLIPPNLVNSIPYITKYDIQTPNKSRPIESIPCMVKHSGFEPLLNSANQICWNQMKLNMLYLSPYINQST